MTRLTEQIERLIGHLDAVDDEPDDGQQTPGYPVAPWQAARIALIQAGRSDLCEQVPGPPRIGNPRWKRRQRDWLDDAVESYRRLRAIDRSAGREATVLAVVEWTLRLTDGFCVIGDDARLHDLAEDVMRRLTRGTPGNARRKRLSGG